MDKYFQYLIVPKINYNYYDNHYCIRCLVQFTLDHCVIIENNNLFFNEKSNQNERLELLVLLCQGVI